MKTALAAGALGAITTNGLHEIVRRAMPNAPRLDVLGMQALAKFVARGGGSPPTGRTLYGLTLAGDLASNAAYYALVGLVPRTYAVRMGLLLGAASGIGAVCLPPSMGLDAKPTARTPATRIATIALYTAGGLTAGLVRRG
jgi:hypothetical protein